MKNKLYFFIGLARSGKSTIAKKWIDHEIDFTNDGVPVPPSSANWGLPEPRVVVGADDWRLALGHRYNSYVEPLIHPQTRIAVRALLKRHNVLVDETNTNKMSIIQWLEEDIDAIPVFVNTHVDICKKRALETGQPDLVPVLDRMYTNLRSTFGNEFKIHETVNKLKEEAMVRSSFNRIVV